MKRMLMAEIVIAIISIGLLGYGEYIGAHCSCWAAMIWVIIVLLEKIEKYEQQK